MGPAGVVSLATPGKAAVEAAAVVHAVTAMILVVGS